MQTPKHHLGKILIWLLAIGFFFISLPIWLLIKIWQKPVTGKRQHLGWKKFATGIIAVYGLVLGIGVFAGAQDTPTKPAENKTATSKITKPAVSSSAATSSSTVSSSSSSSSSSSVARSASSAVSSPATKPSNAFNSHHGLTTVATQVPLKYQNKRQMVMAELDQYGRAVDSHIQLNDSEEPGQNGQTRTSLTLDPAGWHNYNFYYLDGGVTKRAWLMNRGHLVGYQFSGLNNEARNLVVETAYFNAGGYKGMDSGREGSMLHFEDALDSWVANHPNYRLDYQVTPMYEGAELVPREIRLAYVGYDKSGDKIAIKLGSNLETAGNDGATVVYLQNDSPNAKINYATGTAVNTVPKAKKAAQPVKTPVKAQQSSSAKASSNTTATNSNSNTTVYVAGGGTSDVYWYSTGNMPANTNQANVVSMSEAEATAQGKRHSLRE